MKKNNLITVVSDGLHGGAAAATNHLTNTLRLFSFCIERWHFSTGCRPANSPWEMSLDPRNKRPSFERLLKNISLTAANKLRHRRHTKIFLESITAKKPTLVNLHNIHESGVNHDSLLKLPPDIPLVWTMHDCWPFLPEAFQWKNSRLNCIESTGVDTPKKAAVLRRNNFFARRSDVVLVAPSQWMAKAARNAVPPCVRIEQIPYGVDTENFHPIPQNQTRENLKISKNRHWLGFGSTWASTRKGTDILFDALNQIDCTNVGLLLWGEEFDFAWPENLEVKKMGPVKNQSILCELYSACDFFICPSRADNLPNAVLESLACGTPVIGSSVGGIPDMVRPNENGWLFEPDKPENCASEITKALQIKTDWPRLRGTCRQVAEKEFGLNLQAQRYAQLFSSLEN